MLLLLILIRKYLEIKILCPGKTFVLHRKNKYSNLKIFRNLIEFRFLTKYLFKKGRIKVL